MKPLDLFETKLWQYSISDESVNRKELWRQSLILRDRYPAGIQKSNRGGWHSPFLISTGGEEHNLTEDIKNLNNNIIDIDNNDIIYYYMSDELKEEYNYLNKTGLNGVDIEINESWLIVNENGDENLPHTHPGNWISGVYYIKVPTSNIEDEISGDIIFINPNTIDYSIGDDKYWIAPPTDVLSNEYKSIRPSDGMLLLFPSWLWHMVTPNQTDEERIAYSFNISHDSLKKKLSYYESIINGN